LLSREKARRGMGGKWGGGFFRPAPPQGKKRSTTQPYRGRASSPTIAKGSDAFPPSPQEEKRRKKGKETTLRVPSLLRQDRGEDWSKPFNTTIPYFISQKRKREKSAQTTPSRHPRQGRKEKNNRYLYRKGGGREKGRMSQHSTIGEEVSPARQKKKKGQKPHHPPYRTEKKKGGRIASGTVRPTNMRISGPRKKSSSVQKREEKKGREGSSPLPVH